MRNTVEEDGWKDENTFNVKDGTYSPYCVFELYYEWMKVIQIFGMNIHFDPDKYSNIPALAKIMDDCILNNKCDSDKKNWF